MAIPDTVTLNNAAGTSGSFDLIERVGKRSQRLLRSSTLATPIEMIVSHQVSGKAPNLTDRHLISFREVFMDATGREQEVVINLTLAVPRVADAEAKAKSLFGYVFDFVSDGAAASWTTQVNVSDVLRNGS
jgi:hypothetical protein